MPEFELPADFPEPEMAAGWNEQLIPVATKLYRGWLKFPLELTVDQLDEFEERMKDVEERIGGKLLTGPDKTAEKFYIVQHLLLDAEFENDRITLENLQIATLGRMPINAQIANVVYQTGIELVAGAKILGNLLRPFSGTSKAETENPLADSEEAAAA